jgi:hypothetical protein
MNKKIILCSVIIYVLGETRKIAMTCSPVMDRKVGDILQILGGGLIP